MVDEFEVKKLYEDRVYERHQFSFLLDGKEYKGDFHEGEIHWLHPHPQQDLDSNEMEWMEEEVLRLLGEHDVIEDVDGIEVETILENHPRDAHHFKLTIDGEEFKGIRLDGKIEWFHPKPRRKIREERVQEVEKQVHVKVKQHVEESSK